MSAKIIRLPIARLAPRPYRGKCEGQHPRCTVCRSKVERLRKIAKKASAR